MKLALGRFVTAVGGLLERHFVGRKQESETTPRRQRALKPLVEQLEDRRAPGNALPLWWLWDPSSSWLWDGDQPILGISPPNHLAEVAIADHDAGPAHVGNELGSLTSVVPRSASVRILDELARKALTAGGQSYTAPVFGNSSAPAWWRGLDIINWSEGGAEDEMNDLGVDLLPDDPAGTGHFDAAHEGQANGSRGTAWSRAAGLSTESSLHRPAEAAAMPRSATKPGSSSQTALDAAAAQLTEGHLPTTSPAAEGQNGANANTSPTASDRTASGGRMISLDPISSVSGTSL